MEQNFTSRYLSYLKKKGVIDEIISGATNNPVNTITFSEIPITLPKKPKLIYKKKITKEIEPYIIPIDHAFKKIKELGLEIISKKIKKKWKKGQIVEYKIRRQSFFDDEDVEILKGIPTDHKVLFDRANG